MPLTQPPAASRTPSARRHPEPAHNAMTRSVFVAWRLVLAVSTVAAALIVLAHAPAPVLARFDYHRLDIASRLENHRPLARPRARGESPLEGRAHAHAHAHAHARRQPRIDQLEARSQPDDAFRRRYFQSNYKDGDRAPDASKSDAPGQTVVVGDRGDNSQRQGCPTVFVGLAQVKGSATSGWAELPQLVGFDLDRDLLRASLPSGATQPVYVESAKDRSKVRRVVVAQPGQPRDTWKYAALLRNSLLCASANASLATAWDDVMIVAPAWLADVDVAAGAGVDTDVRFKGGDWSLGANAVGPNAARGLSSMDVVDSLVASLLSDRAQFPLLQSVYVAGHSLGASFTQRYAMLRKADPATDGKVGFWIGNPGAYVWPDDQARPVRVSGCSGDPNGWPFGLGSGVPAYAASRVSNAAARAGTVQAYRARKVQYALGLQDQEQGDTHCQASFQGANHLQRGSNFQKQLQSSPGGVPASQSFNFVAGVAHQDYFMMADPQSQQYLFADGIDFSSTSAAAAGNNATSSSQVAANAIASPSKSSSTSSASSNSTDVKSGAARNAPAMLAVPALAVALAMAMVGSLTAVTL